MIRVNCPNCERAFKVRDEFIGKKGKCPICRTSISISAQSSQSELSMQEVSVQADSDTLNSSANKPAPESERKLEYKSNPLKFVAIGVSGLLVGILILTFYSSAMQLKELRSENEQILQANEELNKKNESFISEKMELSKQLSEINKQYMQLETDFGSLKEEKIAKDEENKELSGKIGLLQSQKRKLSSNARDLKGKVQAYELGSAALIELAKLDNKIIKGYKAGLKGILIAEKSEDPQKVLIALTVAYSILSETEKLEEKRQNFIMRVSN